jgi:chromosomal replication initiator protein
VIFQAVAENFYVDVKEILGTSRRKEVMIARQAAMYLLRYSADLSYPTIGGLLGGKNHSTIIHGCEKIQQHLENNTKIGEKVAGLVQKFGRKREFKQG